MKFKVLINTHLMARRREMHATSYVLRNYLEKICLQNMTLVLINIIREQLNYQVAKRYIQQKVVANIGPPSKTNLLG